MDLHALCGDIIAAAYRQDGQLRSNRRLARHLREAAERHGPCVPVGDGDSKTGAPGTYRPVGATCPATCPFLGAGCYAQSGNVVLHQRRALESADAAIRGAAVAMIWARLTGRVARLHVSGDFGRGAPHPYYIDRLTGLALHVRILLPGTNPWVAWTYTHHARGTFTTGQLGGMTVAGISVRFSDDAGPMGAVVHPHGNMAELRAANPGARFMKCPAQLRDNVNCATCKLCWTRPTHTVVFDPHGAGRRQILDRMKE